MCPIHYSERNAAAIRVVRAAAPALCLAAEAVSDCTVALQEAKEQLEIVLEARADNPPAELWNSWVLRGAERVRLATERLKRAEFGYDAAALECWDVIAAALDGLEEAELHQEAKQIA